MSNYPRLTEMGVSSFDHIAGYTVNSLDLKDYLRIDFNRPDGSFLPCSRTYDFPRVQKQSSSGSGDAVVMETNPTLREALDELRTVVGARKDKRDAAASVLEEIQQLEGEIKMHTARIKELIQGLS